MSTAPIPNIALASFKSEGAYTYDPLLSDGHHIVSRMGSVASGIGKLVRGTILKIIPATGVTTIPVAAADCNCVLAENIDATSATVPALVYMSGKMKADAVIWPGALAHADVTDALRNWGILLESVLFRDGLMVKSAPKAAQEQVAVQRIEDNQEVIETRTGEIPLPEEIEIAESSWGHLTAEQRASPDAADLIAPPVQLTEEEGGEGTEPPAGSAVVTITPTTQTILASGGSGQIGVTVTTPGTWSVTGKPAWVTVTPTTPQTASGTVQWTGAANGTGLPRQALLNINGKTFTLNQGAI
jgi:hypothetical protein